ncbi:unnamed protein product (mitochondrion) [Plasmodiophora brassicae]|uniref:Uncharacterized protein n=1 Tax=Plasmodiophora brassicae TaxID=37360 RepID=A0A3P3Y840_PLABS|nr:unnamed protein product [Plasmodiophora brassicae]
MLWMELALALLVLSRAKQESFVGRQESARVQQRELVHVQLASAQVLVWGLALMGSGGQQESSRAALRMTLGQTEDATASAMGDAQKAWFRHPLMTSLCSMTTNDSICRLSAMASASSLLMLAVLSLDEGMEPALLELALEQRVLESGLSVTMVAQQELAGSPPVSFVGHAALRVLQN